MSGSGADKRKGKPRIPRRLPVRFGTEAKMCGGQAVDISEGGMRVESPESFPINSLITVFVQFPRHSVRLRARVIWGGGGSSPAMGLALTQPEPTLKRAYAEWLAEVKLAAGENTDSAAPGAALPVAATPPAGVTPSGAATPAGAAAPAAAAQPAAAAEPAPKAAEPKGPVRRRLESRQGQSYEALLERAWGGWTLTIVQLPRQLGVDAPDFQDTLSDYGSAEKALREFVRAH